MPPCGGMSCAPKVITSFARIRSLSDDLRCSLLFSPSESILKSQDKATRHPTGRHLRQLHRQQSRGHDETVFSSY
jgi:hypothetical protein